MCVCVCVCVCVPAIYKQGQKKQSKSTKEQYMHTNTLKVLKNISCSWWQEIMDTMVISL